MSDYEQRRKWAWELLKNTRNPEYVALRYDFPVSAMREALAKLPDEEPLWKRLQGEKNRVKKKGGTVKPPPLPEREPGSDDDLGEDSSDL